MEKKQLSRSKSLTLSLKELTNHSMKEEYQIVVTCDGCKGEMARSLAMTEEKANTMKSKLVMNPFGAPRCKNCKDVEPYSDINLAHTLTVVPVGPNLS